MRSLPPLPVEVRELFDIATIFLSIDYPDCYFANAEKKEK